MGRVSQLGIVKKIKKISISDIVGIIPFLLVLIPALLKKLYFIITKKEMWLICENKKTARDNGYVFFEYMNKNHPNIKTYYAIDKKCPDYNKLKKYNNIISWGSFRHYYYYMSATKNISSHKEGNPNQTIFTICHLYLNLYNNRVFLQHGILYQNFVMFHKENTKFKIFICGAKPEYDFVLKKYGYNNNEAKYTGLARFDNLHNTNFNEKIILYMPTWRRWFNSQNEFENSTYFKKISSFINNDELDKLLIENDKYLYFCPHFGISKYYDSFKTKGKRIKIVDSKEADIQELLIQGAVLITDFSSLHSDFAYMKKPIIYYQYDEEDYKKRHIGKCYKDTYFDFEKNGFGMVYNSEEDVITGLKQIIKNNYEIDSEYLKRIDAFFELNDTKNCDRIYETIMEGVLK